MVLGYEVTPERYLRVYLVTNTPEYSGVNRRNEDNVGGWTIASLAVFTINHDIGNRYGMGVTVSSTNGNGEMIFKDVEIGRVYEITTGAGYRTYTGWNMPRRYGTYKVLIPDSGMEAKIAAEEAKNIVMSTLEVSSASNGNVKTKTLTIDGQQKHFIDLQATFNNVFNEIGKSAKLSDLTNLESRLNKNISDFQKHINSSLANLEGNIDNSLTELQNQLNNINETVNNIYSSFPPTLSKVSGYNNATATTTGSFRVVLDYSNAIEYRYKVGSGSWSDWESLTLHDAQGYFTVSGLSNGANTIYVEIRNSEESPVAKGRISAFRVN